MIRYVCSNCGKGFASARSARRHIANLESGTGQVVSEAAFRVGLLTKTIPIPVPKLVARNKSEKFSFTPVAREEYFRGYFRHLGEKICESHWPQNKLMAIMISESTSPSSDNNDAIVDEILKIFKTFNDQPK